jgi:hypothetical protein
MLNAEENVPAVEEKEEKESVWLDNAEINQEKSPDMDITKDVKSYIN